MLDLLAQRGYHKPAWFTPVEFASGLPSEISGEVLRFTGLYNAARFGGDTSSNTRLAELLESVSGLPPH
jgi:hypothetical protein